MKRLLFVIGVLFLLSSCNMYQDVQVSGIEDIAITSVQKDHIDMEVTVKVDNPNWYKVKLVGSDIDVQVNQTPLGKVEFVEKVTLEKNSSSTKVLKMRGYSDDITGLIAKNLFAVLFSNKLLIEANGHVKGRALGVSRKVPVEAKEEVSLDGIELN